MTFRKDIEGLRGIAVLAVVLFHCGFTGIRGGFVGVDIFFVLSGYLITGLLLKELDTTSRIHLVEFYARRVRRLLPASAVALLVTLVLAAILLAPSEVEFAARAARASSLYASNVFFATNAADYFGSTVETNPFLHTWSLAVEEQFYFLWPALLWALSRSRRSVPWTLAAISILSFATCLWMTPLKPVFAFYQLPARAWEFGLGGLASMLALENRLTARAWNLISAAGLCLVGFSITTLPSRAFPGWLAAIPVAGTLAVLVAGKAHPQAWISSTLLALRPLQLLGRLSYSWYLWHWPFLVIAYALFPNISLAAKLAVAVGALGCAALAFHWVESPVRFHRTLIAHPRASLAIAAALTLFCAAASTFTQRFGASLEASHPGLRMARKSAEDFSQLAREQCVSLSDSPTVKTCHFGDANATTTIALFGDSHAIQWFDAVERIASRRGWKLHTFVKSGCPFADIEVVSRGGSYAAGCNQWRRDALARIEALHPQAIVVASAHRYLKTPYPDASRAEWGHGVSRTLHRLANAGIPTLFIRDNPEPGFDVPTCVARLVRNPWLDPHTCDVDPGKALDLPAFAAERNALQGLPDIEIADFSKQLCTDQRCFVRSAGFEGVVYRDDNHLTGRFAATLSHLLEEKLLRLLS